MIFKKESLELITNELDRTFNVDIIADKGLIIISYSIDQGKFWKKTVAEELKPFKFIKQFLYKRYDIQTLYRNFPYSIPIISRRNCTQK